MNEWMIILGPLTDFLIIMWIMLHMYNHGRFGTFRRLSEKAREKRE